MKTKLIALVSVLAIMATLAIAAESRNATQPTREPLIIGTGAVTGIYYPAAGAVQRLVNDQKCGVSLAVQSTNGSVANLQAIAAGSLDLAIAQSDWVYFASKGTRAPFTAPVVGLKALLALHAEQLAVIVKQDSGINDLDGLKGKRINLGPQGSGPRTIMSAIFTTMGWTGNDTASLPELPFSDQSGALCNGLVDAIVFLVPHPNAAVQESLARCPTKLLPLTGPAVDQLVANNPFYAKAPILGNTYPNQSADVATFGVRALLVAGPKVSDEMAYAIAKAAFGNAGTLNVLHPALARLTAADMKADGLGLEVHPGVKKYLTEHGLSAPASHP